MSLDNTYDELVVTRAPIETAKPSSKPATDTLSSSSSNKRAASKFDLFPSSALPSALIS